MSNRKTEDALYAEAARAEMAYNVAARALAEAASVMHRSGGTFAPDNLGDLVAAFDTAADTYSTAFNAWLDRVA